jgi:hypothetical protein
MVTCALDSRRRASQQVARFAQNFLLDLPIAQGR